MGAVEDLMRTITNLLPVILVIGMLVVVGYPLLQRSIPFLRPTQTVEIQRAPGQASNPARTEELDIITVLPKDAIPAIDSPRFVSARKARGWMRPDELVIGLSINGDSRAYAINMLSRHEIVNDVVGGKPVAVTW